MVKVKNAARFTPMCAIRFLSVLFSAQETAFVSFLIHTIMTLIRQYESLGAEKAGLMVTL
jgi:hypothetical protein